MKKTAKKGTLRRAKAPAVWKKTPRRKAPPAPPEPLRAVPMTETPCPRCYPLAKQPSHTEEQSVIWPEMVQPLPEGAFAPLAHDRSGKCCFDCASADAVFGRGLAPDWEAARIAVGNDRLESMRLPATMRFAFGLVKAGLVRASEGDDAMKKHHAWLRKCVPEWAARE